MTTTRTNAPLSALALLLVTVGPAAACSDRNAVAPPPTPAALLLPPIEFANVRSLSVTPTSIVAGSFAVGSVTVDSPIDMPHTVSLTSSAPGVAKVPESISLDRDRSTASFPVTTAKGRAGCSIVSARIGSGAPRSAIVFVHPTPSPDSIPFLPLSLSDSAVVGTAGLAATGTVRLLLPTLWVTADSEVVQLSSSNPLVSVPPSVTVPLVSQAPVELGSASFPIEILETIGTPTCSVITATTRGEQTRALLEITPVPLRLPLPLG